MAYCIQTTGLVHAFSNSERVLNNINLLVPEGSIYGFLGPNGAGKTTTLRLLLGLLVKQRGTINVFGKSFAQNRVNILRNTGSLIESPSLYGHLTALDNLRLLQKIYQCPKERITTVLKEVGLKGTGNKKTGRFSLGMKQRLAIAVALLNDPALLVLDEPTNGLDPGGIIEIRELLKKRNREQGTTILVSSHLLPEMEKLVTHAGIINKGELMFQGTLTELVSKQEKAAAIVIETNDVVKAIQVLADNHINADTENGKVILPVVAKKELAVINRLLVGHDIDVYEISTVKNDLEKIFINLTNQ